MCLYSKVFRGMLEEHMHRYKDLLGVSCRIALYSAAMFLTFFVSDRAFDGSRSAQLSMFMILTSTVELLWNGVNHSRKIWWYAFCVAGLAICGMNLLHEATSFQKSCQAAGCSR